MGTIASGAQIIAGGDVDGARRTLQRAFGGDWIVTPGHIATDRQPDPYPDLARASEDDDELPEF